MISPMTFLRQMTFYLVAWLCLSSFVVPSTLAIRYNPNAGAPTTASAPVNTAGVSINANVCIPPVGKFCTYTQAEWGATTTKAANFLNQFFNQLFPNGLLLGQGVICTVDNLVGSVLDLVGGLLSSVLTLLFNNCADIFNFLPAVNPAGSLTSALVNPATCPGGTLAGDLLALALNIAFDANVPAFSVAANLNLSNLVFVKGTCAGLSVKTVFNIANEVLGCATNSLLSSLPIAIPANIDACVALVNANFLDAVHVGAYLGLPGFNLQACVNLNLPVITAAANVQATILAPLSRTVGVFADIQLAGLVNVAVGAALTNGQRCHAWFIDINANVNVLNVAHVVTKIVLPVPSIVSNLLANVVSDVVYVVDDVLCLVNYVLNYAPVACTARDLQAIIYMLTNPTITTVQQLIQRVPALAGCNIPLVNAVCADARAHGPGFIPAPGQILGALLTLNVAGVNVRVMAEVTVPALNIDVSSKLCIAL